MKTIEEAAKEYYIKNYCKADENDNIRELSNIFTGGVEFAQRWIPVDEELPECVLNSPLFHEMLSKAVIVKYDNGQYVVAVFSEGDWYNTAGQRIFKPTHWRPIELK